MSNWDWHFNTIGWVYDAETFIFLTVDANASFKKETTGFWFLLIICGISLLDFGLYKNV